jgi:hypothetical protein
VLDNRDVPVSVLVITEDVEAEKLFFLVTVIGGESVAD